MFQSIRSAMKKWSRQPYVRFLAFLLLTVTMLVGASGSSNDGCTSDEWWWLTCAVCKTSKSTQQTSGPSETFHTNLRGTWGYAQVGETAMHLLGGEMTGEPYPDHVTYIWTPPPGVKNVEFPGRQPDYRRDDGSYVFNNVPVSQLTGTFEEIKTLYEVPPPPGVTLVDTLQVVHPDGTRETGTREFDVVELDQSSSAPPLPAPAVAPFDSAQDEQQEAPAGGKAPRQDYYLWGIDLWYYSTHEVTMTTELCQEWVDFAQEGTTFVALRFPVLGIGPSYTGSYTLPVAFRGEYSPTLRLLDETSWPHTAVLTAPLEYKPARFTFLENELPSAPGEHWLALGLSSSDPITCPEGLEDLGDDWEVKTDVWLDFGGEEGACADCVLPLYYCYEGEEPPLPSAWMARALGAGLGATSYQGWGITCMGPHPLRLRGGGTPDPAFVLYGMHTADISPTQTISFSHYVNNLGGEPVTVTLDYTSTLGLPWGIYSGTWGGPDIPLVPITGPVALGTSWPDSRRYFWMIAEVPTGTQGAETLFITATDVTSPALSTWTSDLLWVGDWVAPPPPPSCNELSNVALVGSPTTTVDIATTFTATTSPPTATLPVTYTWEATEQTPQVHTRGISDTAVFTWAVIGPQVVTVTAVNECGIVVSDVHTITVEAPPLCNELSDVDIAGPMTGTVGILYAFTATVEPPTATLPVTYTWEATEQTPQVHTGGISDTAVFTWAVIGPQVVTVTAANCGGGVSDTHIIAVETGKWYLYLPLVLRNVSSQYFGGQDFRSLWQTGDGATMSKLRKSLSLKKTLGNYP